MQYWHFIWKIAKQIKWLSTDLFVSWTHTHREAFEWNTQMLRAAGVWNSRCEGETPSEHMHDRKDAWNKILSFSFSERLHAFNRLIRQTWEDCLCRNFKCTFSALDHWFISDRSWCIWIWSVFKTDLNRILQECQSNWALERFDVALQQRREQHHHNIEINHHNTWFMFSYLTNYTLNALRTLRIFIFILRHLGPGDGDNVLNKVVKYGFILMHWVMFNARF